ncbi:MAG: Lrp/AsnC family transcriptional regulator [Thermodesulfobacteriota bacterium]|nr:Lrp/AsnC family transcriptional regulator [Thermodesulfobacteriota bacterium]
MPRPDEPGLSPVEKRLIHELGGDLDSGARPFAGLGRRVGLSEDEVIRALRGLKERGYLRRFGATLGHQRSGFKANAMVAWLVEPGRIGEVGLILAAFPEVTHCYQRRTVPGWSRNLYTMIHASSEEECRALAKRMSEAAGVGDYELLFSREELKKTSMRYFP